MEHMKTPLAVSSLNSLDVDENGNWSSKKESKIMYIHFVSWIHQLQKVSTHSIRRRKYSSLDRRKLQDLQEKASKNEKDNIQNQCDDSTFYYNWSGIDLSDLQKNNEINFVQGLKALCIA